ncbi:unnamed protein product [Calicophoron daubneyi]|uniref:Uncharacterized protein n=1 Tax=Calicophoron daubneyi TaxID=300641 RepID=A0AAV2TJS7_CALDB
MDNVHASESASVYLTLQSSKHKKEEKEQNDTAECITLPDIEVPDGHSLCFTSLPGSVLPGTEKVGNRKGRPYFVDANVCNTTTSVASRQESRPVDLPEPAAECASPHPVICYGSVDQKKESESDKPDVGKTRGEVTVPQKNNECELSDQYFASARDNVEFSNASKPGGIKYPRPQSESPYMKHVFDPPKETPICPKDENRHLSPSETDASDESGLPKSTIFITKSQGLMYKLQFYTRNSVFSPLYVGTRFSRPAENDKKIQPPYYEYRQHPQGNDLSAFFVRQKYAISMDDQHTRKKKYILPPLRVYTDSISPTRKRRISESDGSDSIGNVYFTHKDVLLRVRCTPLPITQMKMPVSPDILQRMEKLHMPSSESRKNKGVVVCRCGFDLLQFTFDMADITLNKVDLKGTAAVQTEDKMVYIREKSNITGRTLLLALPESTYFYRDPMTMIHRLHHNFQRTNVVPLWKYQLMKQRLAERRGASQTEAKIDRAFKQTRGTRIYFEGMDSLITAQGGLMCCEIPSGYDQYEAMMLEEYQTKRYCAKPTPQPYIIKSSAKSANETGGNPSSGGVEADSSDQKDSNSEEQEENPPESPEAS